MKEKKLTRTGLRPGSTALAAITLLAFSLGCHKSNVDNKDLRDFEVVNLVANTREYNPVTVDETLINGFGIAWAPNGTAWVNSVGGHVSELYNAEGGKIKAVNIPGSPATTDSASGFPCGIVFSGGLGFNLSNGPSLFLFTGFDGVLSGWNPASGNNAKFLKHPPNASYTGLAIANNNGRNLIYGANFGASKIDVWDTTFAPIPMTFKDPQLPAGYSPYNIQAVNNYLFVMYAELSTYGPTKGHGIAGAGKGFVSVFNTDGSFVRRFASRGSLNIPWGVTMAPGTFLQEQDLNPESKSADATSGSNFNGNGNHDPKDPVILVGNFGDGHINVFTQDAKYLGQLQSHKNPLVIDGLWALSFGPAPAVLQSRLYFTAGPDNESDGVFGYITKK